MTAHPAVTNGIKPCDLCGDTRDTLNPLTLRRLRTGRLGWLCRDCLEDHNPDQPPVMTLDEVIGAMAEL